MNRLIKQIWIIVFAFVISGASYSFAMTNSYPDYMQLIREKRDIATLAALQDDTINFTTPKDLQEKFIYSQLCYFYLGHIAFDEDSCLNILTSDRDTLGIALKSLAREMGKAYVIVSEYPNAQKILEPIVQKEYICKDSNYVADLFNILSYAYLGQADKKKALEYSLLSFYYKTDKKSIFVGSNKYHIIQLYKSIGDTIGVKEFEQYCANHDTVLKDCSLSTNYYFSPNYNLELFHFTVFPTHRDTLIYLASLPDVSTEKKLSLLHEVELIDKQGDTPAWKGSLFVTYMKIAAIYHDTDSFANEYNYLLKAYAIADTVNKQDVSTIFDREKILMALIQNRLSIHDIPGAFNYYNHLTSEYQSLHGISFENIASIIQRKQIPLSLFNGNIIENMLLFIAGSRKKLSLSYVFTMINYGRLLSTLHYHSGNYSDAIATEMIVAQLESYYLQYGYQSIPVEFVRYDIDGLMLQAKCLYKLREYNKSAIFMSQCADILKSKYWDIALGVDSSSLGFTIYSSFDRDKYIQQYDRFQNDICMYTDINAKYMNEVGYNQALFSKQILLETNNIIRKLAIEHNISLNKLDTLWLKLNVTAAPLLNDSLKFEIEDEERKIYHSIKPYITKKDLSMYYEYQQVRRSLTNKDCAIEFINYVDSIGVHHYIALLLTKRHKHPLVIKLLDETNMTNIYNYANSTEIVNKLLPYIRHYKTIYFSPSGVLHQVAIESLPYDSVSTMSDHFNMVRLSSTRELVLHKHEEHKGSATLYGGIQYDVDTTDLLAESRLYEQTPLLASRGIENDTTNRGSVKYLYGTKKEAESIERILSKHNVSATLYTSAAANEESFKTLSGKHQNIIHIGTHGFYWADSTARKQDFFTQRAMSISEDKPVQYAIDPLDRCGLLFAGANIALSGHSKDLPDGVQDGILTAKEISLMDLRDCDLVVLSACETAKGDITSEGVFGLQRAFKMAGVQTIIMSLWKVNDDATQMLMTEFYTNWIEKKQSKREAFRNAQNAVRYAVDEDGDRMFASPYYWAGFIMLD